MEVELGLEASAQTFINNIKNSLLSKLSLSVKHIRRDEIEADFQVNSEMLQPFGLLNGGISLWLAESFASGAACMNAPDKDAGVVGIEVSANHLKSISSGTVTLTASPIHRGNRIQVWQVDFVNSNAELLSTVRCTLLNQSRKSEGLPKSEQS